MQLLLDNLAATVLSATILLMLFGVTFRSQQAGVEAYTFEALRKQQVNFVETLRRDMLSLTWLEDVEEDPANQMFTFYIRHPAQGVGDSTKVVYARQKVEERDGTDLYQIVRKTGPPGGTLAQSGGSMPTLTAWSIRARNQQGGAIASASEAEQVQVQFEIIPFHEKKKPFDRRRWGATYRPKMLRPGAP